jgi:hypothetical protein
MSNVTVQFRGLSDRRPAYESRLAFDAKVTRARARVW